MFVFDNIDIISSYTRADALKDGALLDMSPFETRKIYKYPVAVTKAVWALVTKAVEAKNRESGVLDAVVWDILFMSQRDIYKRIDDTQHLFRVIIASGEGGADETHVLKIMCHPGDHLEPVLTILLENED